jgi:putative ABC transport system permease protein
VSGSYPAFTCRPSKPAAVLKGLLHRPRAATPFAASPRGGAVCHFAGDAHLHWIVYDQLNYMRNKDLGYDKEQVLTISYPKGQPRDRYNALKNLLLANPQVRYVASANAPASQMGGRIICTVESNEGIKEMGFKPAFVDYDYIKTMGMKIVQGRDFSDKIPADTALSVIVNETTVKRMNWKQPLGKRLRLGGQQVPPGQPVPPMAQVIGVVKDFTSSRSTTPSKHSLSCAGRPTR